MDSYAACVNGGMWMWLWVLYFEGVDLDLVLLLSLLDVVAVGWLCECCSKLIFRFFSFFFVLIFSSGCSSCVELLLIFLLR